MTIAKMITGQGGSLFLSVTPSSANGSTTGGGTCVSNPVTVSVSGGIGPYTYAWTKVSGDTMTLSDVDGATTTFSASVGINSSKSAVYRCTVTDNVSVSKTIDVSVSLFDITFEGGGGIMF